MLRELNRRNSLACSCVVAVIYTLFFADFRLNCARYMLSEIFSLMEYLVSRSCVCAHSCYEDFYFCIADVDVLFFALFRTACLYIFFP